MELLVREIVEDTQVFKKARIEAKRCLLTQFTNGGVTGRFPRLGHTLREIPAPPARRSTHEDFMLRGHDHNAA
jgi:hypothetical protein